MSFSRLSVSLARQTQARQIAARPLSSALLGRRYASGPTTDTKQESVPTTQGHTSKKDHGLDVQNQSANRGQAEKASAQSSGNGDNQPFDAARMGGSGGESKQGEGKGAFMDQNSGQEGGASKMGGTEDTAGGSTGDMIKKALGIGKDERHQSVMSPSKNGDKRSFHTSSRSLAEKAGGTQPDGSRTPKEANLQGEQNEHLTHSKTAGKDNKDRQGNAADEPHLPSKSSSASGGAGTGAGKAGGSQARGIHSSARARVDSKGGYVGSHKDEPSKAGYDTPAEALPPNLESAYNRAESQPPKPNMTPSSEAQYSSTAQDPPNQALQDVVKGGGMDPKNPQPTGDVGKQGLDEAWKNRKA